MLVLLGENQLVSEGGKCFTVPVWKLLLVRWCFLSDTEQFENFLLSFSP